MDYPSLQDVPFSHTWNPSRDVHNSHIFGWQGDSGISVLHWIVRNRHGSSSGYGIKEVCSTERSAVKSLSKELWVIASKDGLVKYPTEFAVDYIERY